MSDDKTVRCECGFYNRDKFHTKVGGGRCDLMSKTASQKLLRDLNQRIGHLEHEKSLMAEYNGRLEQQLAELEQQLARVCKHRDKLYKETRQLREALFTRGPDDQIGNYRYSMTDDDRAPHEVLEVINKLIQTLTIKK